MNVLLDEDCTPRVRDVIGNMLTCADSAAFAVSNIRVAALDLAAAETQHVRRCRILLRQLEYGDLGMLASPRFSRQLTTLRDFTAGDRLEVRSAGIGGWSPDFSVFSGSMGLVCLVGAHYFRDPPVAQGPSFTCVVREQAAATRALRRFDELWEMGHDVRPAVIAVLETLETSARSEVVTAGS
jgi:hypothetical protein